MKAGWREMEKRGWVNGGGKRDRVDGGVNEGVNEVSGLKRV